MGKWLAVAFAAPLAMATGAQAQVKGLLPSNAVSVATTRALDLRLHEETGYPRAVPLVRGMIVHRQLAPNSIIGVGMANIYAKRKGSDLRVGERPARAKKPAVTFLFRF
jgi:hypothetical protein